MKDPRIIKLCDRHGWVLVTTDSNMEKTHCELIKTTQVAILATAHNHAEDMEEWVDGLIAAKAGIERHFKKTQRPWCATFTRGGQINIHIVTEAKRARRHRPSEIAVLCIYCYLCLMNGEKMKQMEAKLSLTAVMLLGAAGFIAATGLSGCLVAGYSSGGGWFIWPGSLGLLFLLLILYLVLRRR